MNLPAEIPGPGPRAINGTDAQLIWELVAKISAPAEVLARYGLDAAKLKLKMKDQMFRGAFREAKALWESDLNVEERVKVKARFMVEDGLMTIFSILKSEAHIPQMRLEAFEKLMKAGDLGPKKNAEGGTKPFSIVMQFSDASKKVEIHGSTIDSTT